MSYFIFDGVLECGEKFKLSKKEARHLLKSRRFRQFDRFFIQDNSGKRFEAIITDCSWNDLTFVPEFPVDTPPPSALRLEILQALTKEKTVDWILQKATELGVSRLDFFCGKFSPLSFRILKKKNPLNRWNRIVLEASKQCGRQFPPEIFYHENLKTAIGTLQECQNSWFLNTGNENSFSCKELYKKKKFEMHHRILVGPEGGFHSDEIDLALNSGMIPINLGQRILRSETATITAVAIFQFLYGDLN